MFRKLALGVALATSALISVADATSIIRIDASAFTAQAGKLTFSEFPVGTVEPVYTPATYGGDPTTAPTVTFAGYFTGQALGTAATCPAGAALSGCVVGTPTGPLSLDTGSPDAFITTDGSFPTSPTLSGSPRFNGPIAILFDRGMAGVGLEGGFFNAVDSTSIKAFDVNGNLLGETKNSKLGIDFLGLVTDDGSESIRGILFSLVGPEPAGFNIDNLFFGRAGQVVIPGVPEPSMLALLGLAAAGLAVRRRRSA